MSIKYGTRVRTDEDDQDVVQQMIEQFRIEQLGLEELWRKGVAGIDLLGEFSRLVDRFLVDCFQEAIVKDKDISVALVALGGYGRQELFPCSDVDLMILYQSEYEGVNEVADGVLYPLRDTGLEVSHGIRSVDESVSQAQDDYFFRVALLDARLICGSRELFEDLRATYWNRFIDGCREEFVVETEAHRYVRREQFGTHSYLLEPDIKEGRGGIRDIQDMFWTARVVFGLNGLEDMCSAGLLFEEEKKDFLAGMEMLVRLRNYLHCHSNRKNDQLYFEQQEDAAEALGYKAGNGMLAVEGFMREVYGCLQSIAVITDLFFDHVDEVLGLMGRGRNEDLNRVVEKGVEVLKGKVHLTARADQLQEKPHTLIRLFLVMARTGLSLHYRTRKIIPGYLYLIDEKVRASPRLTNTFFNILSEAQDVFSVLETMLETGLLPACIPEFSRIITLAQYDVYHIYTVDRHSLHTVMELKLLTSEMERSFGHVKSMKVLYLGALLHDIGKGEERDHSIEGARIAVVIGKRLGLSEEDCDSLGFLVRFHLYIPENALRRDLNDTIFIKKCSETIGDLNRLSMLYILSVADSKATGPAAWSEWKAALMEELYLKVYSYLDYGGSADITELEGQTEQGVEWLRRKVAELLEGEKGIRVDVATLSTDYMLSFDPDVVARHVLSHRDNYQLLRQKSLVRVDDGDDCWSILLMAADRPGLLAKICGVMALNNLVVINAQIFTWDDGTVVDVIEVRPTDGSTFTEKDWRALGDDLDKAICHRLGLAYRLYKKISFTHGQRQEVVGDIATKVVIDNKSSDIFSIIEVYSADLPGQLYRITQMLADFGMNIHKAYIATEVGQLIDVFYVLDSQGEKLIDEELQQEITQGLIYSVDRSAGL